ncbi:4-hydroxy-tetrahydrodipicolinate synthase [Paraburkholderia sp. C35]|uniref:4-hydroxy-tetrahydrodipicolinate synthase n=1 Tax=Paraburkholderia sp. C35 TaxID=2126993 RepID=UPI000D68C530|nr:4-hydroxy-tetrahydrodipicolinate synthase [Paraburkholderia sp. C35]
MSTFSGIWIPLVTPFSADGAVDHAALRRLIRLYADAGVAGVVALGTTGEPSSLDVAEQEAVLATTLDAAGDAVPVIVGVSGNNAPAMRERVQRLNALPLAGLLVSAPYYVRPSQAGIAAHFTMLADASEHPVVLYDIPARTGVRIELETLLSLAAHPRIQAIKDCAGSLDTTHALILDGRLQVLAGDDIRIFDTLCMGGSGAIAASAHVWPERFVALDRALKAGRLDDGRALFHALVPLIRTLTAESNPAPVKAALAAQGLMDGGLRAPMTQASESLRERLLRLLAV